MNALALAALEGAGVRAAGCGVGGVSMHLEPLNRDSQHRRFLAEEAVLIREL